MYKTVLEKEIFNKKNLWFFNLGQLCCKHKSRFGSKIKYLLRWKMSKLVH